MSINKIVRKSLYLVLSVVRCRQDILKLKHLITTRKGNLWTLLYLPATLGKFLLAVYSRSFLHVHITMSWKTQPLRNAQPLRTRSATRGNVCRLIVCSVWCLMSGLTGRVSRAGSRSYSPWPVERWRPGPPAPAVPPSRPPVWWSDCPGTPPARPSSDCPASPGSSPSSGPPGAPSAPPPPTCHTPWVNRKRRGRRRFLYCQQRKNGGWWTQGRWRSLRAGSAVCVHLFQWPNVLKRNTQIDLKPGGDSQDQVSWDLLQFFSIVNWFSETKAKFLKTLNTTEKS